MTRITNAEIGSYIPYGLLAQLVEHIVHIDGVTGSSPVQTTILEKSELNPDWEWVRISCFYLGNRCITEESRKGVTGKQEILCPIHASIWTLFHYPMDKESEENTMNELASRIHDDQNGLDYMRAGDYYIPDIRLILHKPIGKYGRMRRRYLEQYRPVLYNRLVLSGKLSDELYRVDQAANALLDVLIPQMAKDVGVTEKLKAQDQMRWIGMMNTIKAQAEEIVLQKII